MHGSIHFARPRATTPSAPPREIAPIRNANDVRFSDGFASDPFKGSDPFAADILFPEANVAGDEVCDEVGTDPSGAENRASTGTQCFESEFPDEESDAEIGDSREDLDALPGAGDRLGFQPIQSSSEELGPSWRSRGHCSVESDPNGYELDLGAISPPSDIEERSRASPAGEFEAAAQVERGTLRSCRCFAL